MKKHLAEVVLLALALVFLTGLGVAQERLSEKGDTSIAVNVPFPFMVGDTLLQPGKYIFERIDVWQWTAKASPDGKVIANFNTEPTEMAQAPMKGRAVFNVYGDKYFLSKIWFADMAYGYYVPKSSAEKAVMKMGPTETKEVPVEK